jgi:HK97 family phage major capsid protein
MSEFIKTQQELRANLVSQMQEALDEAEVRGGFDAETEQKVERIEADIRKADEAIAVAQRNEERKLEASVAAKGFVPSVSEERGAAEILRAIASGEMRDHTFERRAALAPADATVPKSFFDEVFDVARLTSPLLETSQVIATASGEDLTIPTLTAYSTASLVAAAGTVAASEPTYSSITLGAYKYGFLIQAANELVTDAGFDLAAHLAQEAGNGIGYGIGNALTNGTGTVEPTGIVTAAGSGVTGGTGVSGVPTADNLIDLIYSLDGAVRRLPGMGIMATGTTIGAIRKLKDTAGNYLYQVGVGQPDTFAGVRVVENPHVPATGTGEKSVLAGDLNSYKVRTAGGLQVASSQDYAFNTDLTTWRFLFRVDGNLTHASHIKYFKGGAS